MKRERKGVVLVGVDISKDTLCVAWKGLAGNEAYFEVPNTLEGIEELLKRVTGGRIRLARIVLESTGPYSAALTTAAVNHAKVQVMRLRPQDAKNFSKTLARGKTDRLDAHVLLAYAERMPFKALVLPSERVLGIRAMSRMLSKMVKRRAACVTEFKSARVQGTADVLERYHRKEREHYDALIRELERDLLALLTEEDEPSVIDHWTDIKGVANRTVVTVLPEFLAWPKGLTPSQVTAMAGLDPVPKQSGTRGNHGSWHISRQGNARIRRVLWTCAACAVRHEPRIKAYYQAMLDRKKPRMVALVAVMRKLLIALWKMYQANTSFSEDAFSLRLPQISAANA